MLFVACLTLLLALSGSWADDTIINGKKIASGLLVLQQSSALQHENAAASAELKERLEYFLGRCLSFPPDITKKKARQGLPETISAVSALVIGWPLDGNLRDLKRQQGEVVRLLFRAQGEWQYWAEDKVLQVSKSSQYRGAPEAMNITEEVNERYSQKLRSCASEFIWLQIVFNRDLAKDLQSPSWNVIRAGENCPSSEPKECLQAVEEALTEFNQPAES